MRDTPEEGPDPVNAFGDPIGYQWFQDMDINKVLSKISYRSFDLKMLKCWVKGNENERLSLRMQNTDLETLPMLLLRTAEVYGLNARQLFNRLKILVKSKDFNWDHKDVWGKTFIDDLNLYVEDNPGFKKFAEKLVSLKK